MNIAHGRSHNSDAQPNTMGSTQVIVVSVVEVEVEVEAEVEVKIESYISFVHPEVTMGCESGC